MKTWPGGPRLKVAAPENTEPLSEAQSTPDAVYHAALYFHLNVHMQIRQILHINEKYFK